MSGAAWAVSFMFFRSLNRPISMLSSCVNETDGAILGRKRFAHLSSHCSFLGGGGAEGRLGGGNCAGRLVRRMGLFNKLLHAGEGKRLKAVQAIVPEVNAWESEIQALSDDALVAKTAEFKGRVDQARANARDQEHEKELVADCLDDLLPEAFSVVREAGKRVLGQRHFDVQVMGGAALHLGWVAEMKTGEGKTLVATLPSYLNALAGRGVHVITVNDYLAKFHAQWMGRLYGFLGLSTGLIIPDDSTPDQKRAQY